MKKLILILFSAPFVFIACTRFISILQPEAVNINSSFEVPITVLLEGDNQVYNEKAYFGLQIPIGWEVIDSVAYTGAHKGSWILSTEAFDSISQKSESKEGYYWCAFNSDLIDTIKSGTVTFKLVLHTDNQVGRFYIDYVLKRSLQTNCNGFPIDVGLPTKLTVLNTNDNGEGSFREALQQISAGGEITFDLDFPATIKLDSQLVLNKSVKIYGPEDNFLTISGEQNNRVFFIVPDSGAWRNVEFWDRATWERKCFPCGPINVDINNLIIADGYVGDGVEPSGYYSYGGGGILSAFSNLKLNKAVLVNNHSGRGAAIHKLYEGDLTVNKTTIANNNSPEGAIYLNRDDCYCEPNYKAIITNSILWNNSEWEINDLVPSYMFYSNVKHGNYNEGNINEEPRFADTTQNDFRLALGSPCIDMGVQDLSIIYDNSNNTHYIPIIDYIGDAPDMGAYEFGESTSTSAQTKLPETTESLWNFPNPFGNETIISYYLSEKGHVLLKVIDLYGNTVAVLENKTLEPKRYNYGFNASGLKNGIYFCILNTASGNTSVLKILISK